MDKYIYICIFAFSIELIETDMRSAAKFLCLVIYFIGIFTFPRISFSQVLEKTPEQFIESISNLKTNQVIDTLSFYIKNRNISNDEYSKLKTFLISILQNAENSKSTADAYYFLGKAMERHAEFDEAETYLASSIKKYSELSDSTNIAFSYRALGNLQTIKGNYGGAIKSLLSAIRIYEKLTESNPGKKPPVYLAHSYTALGIAFNDIGKSKESYNYYFKAEHVYKLLNDSIGIAGIYNNIGMLYEHDSIYNDASKYYRNAAIIAKKLNNEHLLSIVLVNLGSVTINQGEIDKAQTYFNEALELSTKLNRKKGIITSTMNLGHIFFRKMEYVKSNEKYLSALKLIDELGETMLKIEALNNISTNYEKIGDYKNSLFYKKEHFKLKDSIFDAETNLQIFDLNTKYKTEQKEKELQALKLKENRESIERQKIIIYIIIAAVFISIFISVVYIRLYYQNRKLVKELAVAKEIAEKADKLKTEIIANMNHEIRTPLNFIKSSAALIKMDIKSENNNELTETLEYLDTGINRLTRTLELFTDLSSLKSGNYTPNPAIVDLKKICEYYIPIYKEQIIKENKNIEMICNTKIDNAYIKADERNTEKIIEFILDNAYKFTSDGKIIIELLQKNAHVYQLIIEDTGVGIAEDYKDKIFEPFSQEDMSFTRQFEGIGLSLALAYEYALVNNFKISFESSKGKGTKFILEFPLFDISREVE